MEQSNFAAPACIGTPSNFDRVYAIERVRAKVADMTYCWSGSPSRADVRTLLEAYDELVTEVTT